MAKRGELDVRGIKEWKHLPTAQAARRILRAKAAIEDAINELKTLHEEAQRGHHTGCYSVSNAIGVLTQLKQMVVGSSSPFGRSLYHMTKPSAGGYEDYTPNSDRITSAEQKSVEKMWSVVKEAQAERTRRKLAADAETRATQEKQTKEVAENALKVNAHLAGKKAKRAVVARKAETPAPEKGAAQEEQE